ncbi:hypothetical protein ATI61_113217 [Archangium gephyra]|uniref:Uncharacterized protein n=1 Tax=Archangium gephyra TaxID=48 RepID=A0AAC8TFX7_9BACT|nr:hypothetical protein [Archangium gephyra]AKJ03031.1 Hypothetical protein AA314_04657 [Archangium gephyra]REG25153.1 hypothetical protein ATI61_113217 [Archangium gephyra]
MLLYAYTYVGPEEIRRSVASFPAGTPITSRSDLETWLAANPDALAEGATYVVDLQGRLRLAPRRSEHVACAGGEEVLAAGELRFRRAGTTPCVAEVSNQSTGYCPDTDCWAAVALALGRAGVTAPPGFTHEVIFRRCERCGERNLVKEGWFVCVFCDADLPTGWNIAPRRGIQTSS